MIYNKFKNLELSALGLGTMRLPLIENSELIDEEKTAEMVEYAIEKGINYFDTAYGYHNGNSERVIGKVLKEYPRESFYLATKFPGYDLSNMDKVKEIFEEQLEKCKVEYFDFYLFHNVYEKNVESYLDEKYGIMKYLLEQKKNGRIKHLGCSVHGSYDVLKQFLEAYGNEMEFCQLQINYVDWNFEDAKSKVQLVNKYNIPIWVMEPLRGGMLANLTDEHTQLLKDLRPNEDIPSWAFRFLQTIPNITMVLSGMSNMEQLVDNIKTYEKNEPLSRDEMTTILDIGDIMVKSKTLPCTSCRYCVTYCPQKLDIPKLLGLYNEHCFTGGGFRAPMAVGALPENKQPSACIGCRSCEEVCPQQLKISEALKDFTEKLK